MMKKGFALLLCCICLLCSFPAFASRSSIDMNEVVFKARETNGHAWIGGVEGYRCVSTDGAIHAELPSGSFPESYIYNGYSIVHTPQGRALVDVEGTTIFSEASIGAALITWGEENDPLADGIIMAARANESYMGVTYEFGMLNTAGEWLAPLSASHPIVQSGFAFDPHTAWTQQISYAGEGVFLFKIAWNAANGHDCTDGLYDVYSNRAFPYRFHGISSMPAQNVRFVNDQAVLMATGSAITPKLEVLRRDGSVHTLAEFPAKAVGYEVDRRLCISEDRFFTVHSNGWNTLCALWTRQGELVRAFENLTIFPYGTFVDGRAPAILKNELGSLYFTLLNTDGTFAFEPVSISSDAYQLPHMPSPVDENDSIVCFNGRQTILKGKSAYFIYDADGTLLGSFPLQCYYGPYKVAGQNNGVFCIQLNDHLYDYITGSELPAYQ